MKFLFALLLPFVLFATACENETPQPRSEPEPPPPFELNENCLEREELTNCQLTTDLSATDLRALMTGVFHEYHYINPRWGVDTTRPCGVIDTARLTVEFFADGTLVSEFYNESRTGTWTIAEGETTDGTYGNLVRVSEQAAFHFEFPSRYCDGNFFFKDSRIYDDGLGVLTL